MIVQKEFLDKLRKLFKLNIYEVKIWTALLSRGVATAGELSDIAGVPRSRSYDVLETLEKKGFIMTKIGKPIRYIAVHPHEIVTRIQRSVQENTKTQVDLLNTIKDTDLFSKLQLLHKQGIDHIDPSTLTDAITGRNQIYSSLKQKIEKAKKSIVISTTADGLQRKIKSIMSALKRAKERNVKITIYTPKADKNKTVIKKFAEIAEIISASKPDSRFIIIDNKEVLLFVMDDKEVHENYDTCVWVKTELFANALNTLLSGAHQK